MARMDCNMEKLHYYQSLSLLNPSRGTRLGEKEGTPKNTQFCITSDGLRKKRGYLYSCSLAN